MARCVYIVGVLMVAMVGLLGGANGVEYTVGDSRGWALPPNGSTDYYNEWASNNTFFIGDQLVFNWNGSHTAADVSEEEYENCTKNRGFILSTSPVMVNLTSNGTRYFICTIDSHCEQGQKMKVTVGDGIPDDDNSAAAASVPLGAFKLLLSTTLVSFFLRFYF